MAASFPDPKRFILLLVALALPLCSAAETEELLPQLLPQLEPDTPIVIDADSSDFDYATNKLLFRNLRLVQGTLTIEAELAETDRLDFADGLWTFTGSVVFQTTNTTLKCDWAELHFVNYGLAEARMRGEPAWFEQINQETGKTNSGEAKSIIYKLAEGTLELNEEAQFTDGSNKVEGDLITYDLQAQHLSAGAGSSGPVKILIEPPRRNKED